MVPEPMDSETAPLASMAATISSSTRATTYSDTPGSVANTRNVRPSRTETGAGKLLVSFENGEAVEVAHARVGRRNGRSGAPGEAGDSNASAAGRMPKQNGMCLSSAKQQR